MKKIIKALGIIIAVLLAIVVLFLGGLNIAKFAIYSEYYGIESNVCKNPGLSDGFVCQGITSADEDGLILVSGYMKDHSASRIYVTNEANEDRYVTVCIDGEEYTGHAGGIACHLDKVYLASDDSIHVLLLEDILNAKCGDPVDAQEVIPVNNEASFAFADDDYLYVGEFHDGDSYVTNHPYDTPNGLNHAIVSRYSYDDLTAPEMVYSLPDKVQGFCITDEGEIVLSTSFGLNHSYFYVYDLGDTFDSQLTLDGAPVYFLGECEKTVKAPAMAEGLDLYKGQVITLYESACDKYIFGKFFFANHIVGLDF